MIEIRNGDRILKMATTWDEVTLSQFIDLYKITESKEFLTDDIYLIRIVEKLCNVGIGDLDEITFEDLLSTAEQITFMNELPKGKKLDTIVIDGVTYAFVESMMKLKMGEYISIKTISENISSVEAYPKILSIICREADLINDKWTPKKFNGDIDEIKRRENIFMKQPITLFLENINEFFFTKAESPKILKNFTETK